MQWLKAEGERVAKGEPLAEIETDKATVEIEALADGVLARVAAAVGDDVPVGQVIAVILTPEEVLREEKHIQGAEPERQPHISSDAIEDKGSASSPVTSRPSQNGTVSSSPETLGQFALPVSPPGFAYCCRTQPGFTARDIGRQTYLKSRCAGVSPGPGKSGACE